MWLTPFVFASLLAIAEAPLQGSLTDQEVARAIARAGKLAERDVCVGRPAAGEFSVCVQGPEQRIASVAVLARQAHRRLRSGDVSAELKALTWTIDVRPNQPALVDGRPVRTPLAEALTLHLRGHQETPIQPVAAEPIPVTWDNAIGRTLTGQGLTATFDPSTLPAGDLDVVVVAAGGSERRYVLTRLARSQVR
jgi:hypothetical protein